MTSQPGTYQELQRRWKALRSRDLILSEVDFGEGSLLHVAIGDPLRPVVALSAGIHGDEPATPWALLELVEGGALDARFAYRIWPCLNPTGFDAGTRENKNGLDLNRTFDGEGDSPEARAVLAADRNRSFALSLDLHEDYDAAGFYCYEYGGGTIGRRVISALDALGLPVDALDTTLELAGPLRDDTCERERGRLVANHVEEAALLGGVSYSLALARGAARHVLTFETPSLAPWEERLVAHRAGMVAAIGTL